MKLIFYGTAEFAVPSLVSLNESRHEVLAVVTATDKKGGRGRKKRIISPVKKKSEDLGLKILQPKNLKSKDFKEKLNALGAQIQVVVAFRMLPEKVWNFPPYGTINAHASLLPKYRGAAPIHHAIIEGEKESGITVFQLAHKIDTGPILYQQTTEVGEDETTGDLYDRLKTMAANALPQVLDKIESNTIQPMEQDHKAASPAPKIFTEDAEINFYHPNYVVYNFIRGMSPYPGAWMQYKGKKWKVLNVRKNDTFAFMKPGEIYTDNKNFMLIGCTYGALEILRLQEQGSKTMETGNFLNGREVETGAVVRSLTASEE